MTIEKLVAKLARQHGLTKKTTRQLFGDVFEEIGRAAARERVAVPGFGVFRPASRKERDILNPNTKKRIHLPRMHSVRFSAARELKALAEREAKRATRRARSLAGMVKAIKSGRVSFPADQMEMAARMEAPPEDLKAMKARLRRSEP